MTAVPSVRPLVRATVLSLALVVSSPAVAQNAPSGAAIQWAQQILDEAGFYNGRAHGKMDAATATAIANYQKSVGLKATGRLDKATTDRMVADREAKEKPTMGNLADPTARARPSAPILKEQDVIPQAAPSAPGVQVERGAEMLPAEPVIGAPVVGPGAAAPGDVQPQAAARAGVETEGGAPQEPAFDLRNLTAPGWVRYGLLGFVAALLVLMAAVWGFSGRSKARKSRGAKPVARAASGPVRQAPSLERPPAPAIGGRQEPYFPGTGGQPGGSGKTGLRAGRP